MRALRSRLLAVAAAIVLTTGASRASAPAGRYASVTGGVYDTKSKLTWQQPPAPGTYTWGVGDGSVTAATYCASLGGTWRVPTGTELLTLVNFSQSGSDPRIDLHWFPGTPVDQPYWSSTPVAGAPTLAWVLDFSGGTLGHYAESTGAYVRCVR